MFGIFELRLGLKSAELWRVAQFCVSNYLICVTFLCYYRHFVVCGLFWLLYNDKLWCSVYL